MCPTPLKIQNISGHQILNMAQSSKYTCFLFLETPATLEIYFLGILGTLHEYRPV